MRVCLTFWPDVNLVWFLAYVFVVSFFIYLLFDIENIYVVFILQTTCNIFPNWRDFSKLKCLTDNDIINKMNALRICFMSNYSCRVTAVHYSSLLNTQSFCQTSKTSARLKPECNNAFNLKAAINITGSHKMLFRYTRCRYNAFDGAFCLYLLRIISFVWSKPIYQNCWKR